MEKLIQAFRKSDFDIFALRAGVFVVFLTFGIFKWMQFEVDILEGMLKNTWMAFLYPLLGAHGASYLLGVVEGVAYISLFLGFFKPRLSITGDVLVIVTGLVTLSLLPQIGFNSFVFKDVMLMGIGLVLLKHDLGKPA
ncbi:MULTISPECIES: DUF417 family protein [unclassified Neisseria]|uniref:DUF417 family protein n=1 Tax=unclassified Neisseria TaxID=2623750 RepID=UPI0026663817|nr:MULTISPECIES: DUF417 family protein [unclassified Neisseria]MDO1509126.1 DUF417 family protein [Neisseria sp. MVDL19-042950]MDO1516779.1 DUF417 family protein [Neisseria sp. MVDL18-041461]MDO1564009.1 DUF417 family protein [Neisseria sp. MVDL20-010259]